MTPDTLVAPSISPTDPPQRRATDIPETLANLLPPRQLAKAKKLLAIADQRGDIPAYRRAYSAVLSVMPDLGDRERYENEVAAVLLMLLQQQRAYVITHPTLPVPWAEFEKQMRDALTPRLANVYMRAALQLQLMSGQHQNVTSMSGEAQAWAVEQAAKIAADVMTNTKVEWEAAQNDKAARAAALLALFSADRALGIAITEITRAITIGVPLL